MAIGLLSPTSRTREGKHVETILEETAEVLEKKDEKISQLEAQVRRLSVLMKMKNIHLNRKRKREDQKTKKQKGYRRRSRSKDKTHSSLKIE